MQAFIKFLYSFFEKRELIAQLVVRDFKTRYLGSYLGLIWAFIHPCVMIGLLWFVFQVGFRVKSADSNYPFILWLLAGIIPWFFFSDSLIGATSSIIEHSFLVKKVVFRVSFLPIVRILSCSIIHLFFIFITTLCFLFYGYYPLLTYIQIFYYFVCALILLIGITWLTSSVVVFLKDVQQIIIIVVQFGFWLTPIFWSVRQIPEKYRHFIRLNPVLYIIQGYRESLISHVWFWEKGLYTLYFWIFTIAVFLIGAIVFRRLRPHFADVI